MEKLNETEKAINYVLDTRRITPKKQYFTLTATESERAELAKWYEIPGILSLQVDMTAFQKENVFSISGHLTADVQRECVVTNAIFTQPMEADFTLLFSTTPQKKQSTLDIDLEDEPIEFLPRGQIYFKEIITEQFGLNLDPFPKCTTEIFEYRESDTASEKENPFSVLKRLTKA